MDFFSWTELFFFLSAIFLGMGCLFLLLFTAANLRAQSPFLLPTLGVVGTVLVCFATIFGSIRGANLQQFSSVAFEVVFNPTTPTSDRAPISTDVRLTNVQLEAMRWLALSNPTVVVEDPERWARDLISYIFIAYFGRIDFDWQMETTTTTSNAQVSRSSRPRSRNSECSVFTEDELSTELMRNGNVFAGAKVLTDPRRSFCMPPGTRFFAEPNRIRFENAFYRMSIALQEKTFESEGIEGNHMHIIEATLLTRRKAFRSQHNRASLYEQWLEKVHAGFLRAIAVREAL